MTSPTPNPHAGAPFTDDDAAIRAALEDVSIPTLMCALVHITGDPSWIRGEFQPAGLFLNEYQGFMDEELQSRAREAALPVIAAYRDAGCVPAAAPSTELCQEMMSYLACEPVADEYVPLFLEELGLDGRDAGAIEWNEADIPAARRENFPVVVIGCGQSGLLAGIRLTEAGIPFTILEKAAGPGGTWFDNRYPGARVDVGSHFYCYSFEPSDHWTEYFSQQPELQAYFERVLHDYGIAEHTRFNTEVVSATYDEAAATWSVVARAADGTEDTLVARAVISAVGALNYPNTPAFAGIDDFAGPAFHSARWDHSIDYTGKRVAMIGAGASGFQIAPTIAPDVEHLTIFQRTAQWMFPNPNYHRTVPEGDKWAMRHLPFYNRWFRFLTFWPGAGIDVERSRVDPDYDDSDGLAISEHNLSTRGFFLGFIAEQVGDDPELLAKVTPDYPATGKRTLQDNGSWLNALKRDNVDLVRTGIERITETGVVTVDGTEHPVDIICFATGFRHNDFLWPMTITGRDGIVLNEMWGDQPKAHLGIDMPNFPNFFCMYGPGTNLASGGSLIFHSECQIRYIMGCLELLLAGEHRAMEPTTDAFEAYAAHHQSEISQMVWAHWSVTNSHYKNADGAVYTLSPWPIPTYWRMTHQVDTDNYTFS